MINIGLDHPGAAEYLDGQLEVIAHLESLHQTIANLHPLPPSSEFARLNDAFPDAPINFLSSTSAALAAVRGALDQISSIVAGEVPSSPIVLQALLRVALVGAGRVVFTLGPESSDQRIENARMVLTQESRSMTQALDAFAGFVEHGLRPDESYLSEHRRLDKLIRSGAQQRGDGRMLQSMAEVIGQALAAEEAIDVGEDPRLLAEQVAWTWHTYSGLAHAFAWPQLLPTTTGDRRMPGDYVADLGIVVATAYVAFNITIERLHA